MTTSIYRLLAVGLVSTTVFSSCAKLPKQAKYIPVEASAVLDINTRQLENKLVSGGLSLDKLVSASEQAGNAAQGKEVNDTTHESPVAKAVKQAKDAGIDLGNHFFAAYVQDSTEVSKSYVSMVATLLDSANFSKFIKQAVPGAVSGTGDDFAYVYIPDNQTIIGWNADQAVSITHLDLPGMAGKGAWSGVPPMAADTAGDTAESDSTTAAVPAVPAGPSDDSLRHFWAGRLQHLFHLKDNEQATSITSFKALLQQKADVSFWVNSGAMANSQLLQQLPADLGKLIKDSYSSSLLNFEDGKVVVSSSSYVSPTLDSILSKYKTTIDDNMLKNYPSKDITMFLALGFDPHALGDILTAVHVYDIADAGLQSISGGVSLADVLNALSGQIVAVGSDYKQVKKPSPWSPTDSSVQTDMKWIVAAKVKDKAAFQRIMDSKYVSQFFTKDGDRYVPIIESSKFFSTDITADHLTVGSSAALLAQYNAGKSGAVTDENLNRVKGLNAAYYSDFTRMFSEIKKEDFRDSSINATINEASTLFKDVTYSASPMHEKVVKSEMVLALQDGSKNALPQLVSFALHANNNFQASQRRQREEYAKYAHQYDSDSTAEVAADTATAVVETQTPKHAAQGKKH